jgi:hypothetical protein
MTSKIRITLTALAAAFAVAVSAAPIVPAAHAADNVAVPANDFCEGKWNEFAGWVKLAAGADAAGRTADRDYYLELARNAKNDARGCEWAQSRTASLDPLGRGPVGDGLSIQQPDNSPTTGSDPATDPVQGETAETVGSDVDTSTSKPRHKRTCKKGKHKHRKSKNRCKRK